MKDVSYKIYSLGCKVNQYDGDKLGGLLKSAGFILAKDNADLAVVYSCAVTASAIAKSRAMIKKARQENPRAKIILAGCCARAEKMKEDCFVDMVWSGKDQNLLKKIKEEFGLNGGKLKNNLAFSIHHLALGSSRSRYFLKIQDGCEQFCSYCIIPYTRGKLQSRPMTEIIAEAEAAVKAGWQEIVLNGIHLGLFGINHVKVPSLEGWSRGLGNGEGIKFRPLHREGCPKGGEGISPTLLILLKKLVKIEGLKRIRLSSIEVTEVGDKLINFMAKEKKMCRHLHIPLQAGSDKILRLMKRPYDLKYFSDKIKKLRKKMPDIAISTDVIVGFPGETDKDFIAAKNFIKKIKFSRLHVFSFSAHERTVAFKLPNRVKPEIIKNRSEVLRKLSDELAAAYAKKFTGKILEVVVEQNRSAHTGIAKGDKMKGKTQYYFDLYFDKKDIINDFGQKGIFVGKLIEVISKNEKNLIAGKR